MIDGLRAEKSLNEIHKELQSEHGVKMTFMELRLLSADLDIDWNALEPEPEIKDEDPAVVSSGRNDGRGTIWSANRSL